MKKILCVIPILLLVCGIVSADVGSETGDTRTVPCTLYGKQSSGVITAMLVDSDGKLETVGGSGGGGTTYNTLTESGTTAIISDNLSVDNNVSIGNTLKVGDTVLGVGTKGVQINGIVPTGNVDFSVKANAAHATGDMDIWGGAGGTAQIALYADRRDDAGADQTILSKLDSGNFMIANNSVNGYIQDTAGNSTLKAITCTTLNTGQGANELYDMDQNVLTTSTPTFNGMSMTSNIAMGTHNITGLGAISGTGTGTFATVDTGHGVNELYSMNQDVETTDAVVFTTVNTGQGANELYDMNQNVQTTSGVTFDTITVTKDLTVTNQLQVDGGTLHVDSSNNYVGIGTTSPSDTLDVNGSVDISGNLSADTLNVRTMSGNGSGPATVGNLNVTSELTVSGDIYGEAPTLSKSGNYTVTSDDAHGSIIYVDAACTITLPAIFDGANVSVIVIGDVAVDVDVNASDYMILDGTVLDDGDEATGTGSSGDMAVCTYFSADGWVVQTNGWSDD